MNKTFTATYQLLKTEHKTRNICDKSISVCSSPLGLFFFLFLFFVKAKGSHYKEAK